ncbi:sigma-70 family RNA polymerase sigma factor [Pseudoxanthomonas sp.]|uniref:sigma-70 family RNA polymerase sigma factor n=1 Tax=Pseudoxanthomonas sp. TaxID=1871049 RepID=UPI00261E3219|nr:sigma-70 family RNA polymerase sigma factor [Pseudoxanthomonas sp.]WDS36593.1 MAG: sigma-70 family RNA polymerase sigma factor [Pseudoxanthomonas sp.]
MAAQSAQQQQVHALYSDHHHWLKIWFRRRLGSSHQAADLVHDTFVRIIVSRDALADMREPRAYLTTTATRLLLDRARRQAIEQSYLRELAALVETLPGAPSPEETLAALQALEQIGAALQRVPVKPRTAFLLHYLEGQPHTVIAARLGVSTRMVHKYLVQSLLHCKLSG